jgi:pimeloyl-ACP methyl ester carboxylesterase
MLSRILPSVAAILAVHCAFIAPKAAASEQSTRPGVPPPGFTSTNVDANGSRMHYVRGGQGPVVILLHGFPEDWVAYQAVLPRLAKSFTVIAVDLPGLGKSGPVNGTYQTANLASHVHALVKALQLERPYIVGHDLGAHVTYAYVRQFPDAVRGAMLLDTPMPGVAGAEAAGAGMWHVGFMQVPGLAEKLVPGRQEAFLDWFFDFGKFTPAERAYYVRAYQAPQLHSAFLIYRAIPQNAQWNAARTETNNVPIVVGVGEQSPFARLLPTFVDGYRAKGMSRVEGAVISRASHYVVTDNPDGVAELIERHAIQGAPPLAASAVATRGGLRRRR